MTPRTSLPRAALVGSLLLGACGGDAKKDPKAGVTTVTRTTCKVAVSRKADPDRQATASDADRGKAEAAAWADVCAQLPETRRGDCKDDRFFSPTIAHTSAGDSHTVTITLTTLVAHHDGTGESDTSKAEACQAATLQACAAAGAPGDCLAAGTHTKQGESSSEEQVTLHPPA